MKEITKQELLLVNGGSLWTDMTLTMGGIVGWVVKTVEEMGETLPPGYQMRGH